MAVDTIQVLTSYCVLTKKIEEEVVNGKIWDDDWDISGLEMSVRFEQGKHI